MEQTNVNIDIDNNYISIMDQVITIDDMIDNLYYRSDIASTKNIKYINLLFLNGLKESSKLSLNHLIENKLYEAVKNADIKKPIFKYIDYDICDKYNLYTIGYKKSSRTENHIIPIKIYKKDNIEDVISNLEPLYSTLKYKIKEERITRNLRNDLNDFKKNQYMNHTKLMTDLRKFKKNIKNDIKYMRISIYFLLFGVFINSALFLI